MRNFIKKNGLLILTLLIAIALLISGGVMLLNARNVPTVDNAVETTLTQPNEAVPDASQSAIQEDSHVDVSAYNDVTNVAYAAADVQVAYPIFQKLGPDGKTYVNVPDNATTSVTFDIEAQRFKLTNFNEAQLNITVSNTTYMTTAQQTGNVRDIILAAATPANTTFYSVTVTPKDGFIWASSGDKTAKVYSIRVDKKKIDMPEYWQLNESNNKYEKVSFFNVTVPYRVRNASQTNDYFFQIKNFDTRFIEFAKIGDTSYEDFKVEGSNPDAYVSIRYFASRNAGTSFGIRANFKYAASMEWSDGTSGTYKDFTATVVPTEVEAPKFVDPDDGTDGMKKTVDYNGKQQFFYLTPAVAGQLNFTAVDGTAITYDEATGYYKM